MRKFEEKEGKTKDFFLDTVKRILEGESTELRPQSLNSANAVSSINSVQIRKIPLNPTKPCKCHGGYGFWL